MHDGPLPFWTWPPDWWFSTSNLWRVLKNDQKSVSPGFCKLITLLLHSPYMLISFLETPTSPEEALLDQFLFFKSFEKKEKKKIPIRTYKWILFKCEMPVYWSLGENNILSTNRTELNKMGGDHSEDWWFKEKFIGPPISWLRNNLLSAATGQGNSAQSQLCMGLSLALETVKMPTSGPRLTESVSEGRALRRLCLLRASPVNLIHNQGERVYTESSWPYRPFL